MPIYTYECFDCHKEWSVIHCMSEKEECCVGCESININRKPSDFTLAFKKRVESQKTGALTREFIENSKQELKEQKKELDETR